MIRVTLACAAVLVLAACSPASETPPTKTETPAASTAALPTAPAFTLVDAAGGQRSLADFRGKTVVMVTHEPDIAAYAGRTVGFLDGHVESDTAGSEAA